MLQSTNKSERDDGIARLIDKYAGGIGTTLRTRGLFLSDAECADVTMIAIESIWDEPHKLDPTRAEGSLGGFVARIAFCKAIDRLRKLQPPNGATISSFTEDAAASAVAKSVLGPADPELCRDLRNAIDALPGMQRLIALADLAHPDGRAPAAELAKELGTTKQVIYVLRNRFHERILAIFEQHGYSCNGVLKRQPRNGQGPSSQNGDAPEGADDS